MLGDRPSSSSLFYFFGLSFQILPAGTIQGEELWNYWGYFVSRAAQAARFSDGRPDGARRAATK
jgi:hypothetical protein